MKKFWSGIAWLNNRKIGMDSMLFYFVLLLAVAEMFPGTALPMMFTLFGVQTLLVIGLAWEKLTAARSRRLELTLQQAQKDFDDWRTGGDLRR